MSEKPTEIKIYIRQKLQPHKASYIRKYASMLVLSFLAAAGCGLAADMDAYAGSWQYDAEYAADDEAAENQHITAWWWKNDDGSCPKGEWAWIDGNGDGLAECYYFNGEGYMLADTQITDADGSSYTVNENGAWTEDGSVHVYPNQWVPGGKVLTADTVTEVKSSNLNPLGKGFSEDEATHSVLTDEEAYAILMQIQEEYPEGTAWGNERQYLSGKRFGYGCAAFAFMVQERLYGTPVKPRVIYEPDISGIRTGDHIRVNNNTHSIIVLSNNGDSITVAEGNYNGRLHWGRVISAEQLARIFVYRETCY